VIETKQLEEKPIIKKLQISKPKIEIKKPSEKKLEFKQLPTIEIIQEPQKPLISKLEPIEPKSKSPIKSSISPKIQ
jgi:hypothetical protein